MLMTFGVSDLKGFLNVKYLTRHHTTFLPNLTKMNLVVTVNKHSSLTNLTIDVNSVIIWLSLINRFNPMFTIIKNTVFPYVMTIQFYSRKENGKKKEMKSYLTDVKRDM